mmetsp:Transcript_69503/g.166609  ORF Transcript_69503/g.166609 Transcript_69503/m.166609 type:complete len:210 (+) Transcript_69503:197-826(+)
MSSCYLLTALLQLQQLKLLKMGHLQLQLETERAAANACTRLNGWLMSRLKLLAETFPKSSFTSVRRRSEPGSSSMKFFVEATLHRPWKSRARVFCLLLHFGRREVRVMPGVQAVPVQHGHHTCGASPSSEDTSGMLMSMQKAWPSPMSIWYWWNFAKTLFSPLLFMRHSCKGRGQLSQTSHLALASVQSARASEPEACRVKAAPGLYAH